MSRVNVTQSFLPPIEEYYERLQKIWDSGHLTNHGENVIELELKLKHYLNQEHLWSVSNGTLALQIAFKALDLKGEVITTPFSYVATVSSLVWEGLKPVFVDILQSDFCINPEKIEAAITPKTTAILATHVYGHPCNVKAIEKIATSHGLKVIYDAAHAFGIDLGKKSILDYGDISTLSFHATKVFHSVEGGAIICKNKDVANRVHYLRNFGHNGEEKFWGLGVNAKVSELHAAMGNCVLPYMDHIITQRERVCKYYDSYLSEFPEIYRYHLEKEVNYNYSYYPILIKSESLLLDIKNGLANGGIGARRYFYPCLNKLPYLDYDKMPIAEDISKRMLCLPLSSEISETEVKRICNIIGDILTIN
jgi:dTDP-4-amino-4,6-dideoxygalactose transaminase